MIKSKKGLSGPAKFVVLIAASVSGSVHIMLEKFENEALFLRFGLPSTLICHENGAFRKRSRNRSDLKTPAFVFV